MRQGPWRLVSGPAKSQRSGGVLSGVKAVGRGDGNRTPLTVTSPTGKVGVSDGSRIQPIRTMITSPFCKMSGAAKSAPTWPFKVRDTMRAGVFVAHKPVKIARRHASSTLGAAVITTGGAAKLASRSAIRSSFHARRSICQRPRPISVARAPATMARTSQRLIGRSNGVGTECR